MCGCRASLKLRILPHKPSVTYPDAGPLEVNAPLHLTPVNTGGSVDGFCLDGAVELPPGLEFDAATGVISGTPSATCAATTYRITATNAGGECEVVLALHVLPGLPVIAYANPVILKLGNEAAPVTVTSTGGAVDRFQLVGDAGESKVSDSAGLPEGLRLDEATGCVSGTPREVTPLRTYSIAASNESGSATADLQLAVHPELPAFSYDKAVTVHIGDPWTPLAPHSVGGQVASFRVSADGEALPEGLSLNETTGAVEGQPVRASDPLEITVEGSNLAGQHVCSFVLSVLPPVPVVEYEDLCVVVDEKVEWQPRVIAGHIDRCWFVGDDGEPVTSPLEVTDGLELDEMTGVIFGVPGSHIAEPLDLSITCENQGGQCR